MNDEKLIAENERRKTDEFELETDTPKGWGKRHSQIVLGSFCVCLAFIIKSNIGIAIIAMTDPKYVNNSEVYDWDKKTQNTVSSSFFIGYFLMMIPFGIISHRYGGKTPIVTSLGICSVASMLFPSLTKVGGWVTACICRFIQGLCLASILPCLYNMFGKWSPLLERGRATAYMHAGSQFGKILTMAVSGYLSTSSIGWPLIFYVSGLCTFVGMLLMWWLGAESPNHHSTISKVEFDYIKRTSGGNAGLKKLKMPWRLVLTNFPFWAIVVTQCGFIWNLTTVMVEIPAYLNSILGINIKNNGLLSAAPYVAMCTMSFVLGNLFDYLLKKHLISITMARKISNIIGMWLSGALLVAFCFTSINHLSWAIFLLISSVGALAGVNSGFAVTLTDISPNFAGSTLSIGAAFGNLAGVIATLLNGLILADMNDVGQWRTVFGLSAGIMFVTNLVFLIFGTSKVQLWNKGRDASQKN